VSAVTPSPRGPEEDLAGRRRRLEWLIGGRLVVTTLFLGATSLLAVSHGQAFDDFTPRFLIALIAGTYAASIGFAVLLDDPRRYVQLGGAQIAWDLGLTTGLVYVSQGLASVFAALYGVVVLLAALIVGARAARATALAAGLILLVGGIPLSNGWIPAPPDQAGYRYRLGANDAGMLLMANLVGLVLVGLLAGNLAERLHRTGGALRIATASARSLALLTDDIVRSLSSGLVTTDLAGQIRSVNEAGAAMLGAAPREILGREVASVLPVRLDAPTPERAEGEGRRVDGTPFPVGVTRNVLVGSEGRVNGHLVSFQDLSELRELREQADRAERLAALGRLAAGLAHEIRNPLSSIAGSVELVAEAPNLGAEEKQLLSIVGREVDRLNELVGRMLQVGRPQAPAPAPTDLCRLAQEVVAVAEAGPAGGVTLSLSCPASPVVAEVDADQIRQVLWNLLKNALQASPREGEVTVRLGPSEGAGDGVWLEVSDQGPGVPREQAARLFDTFWSGRPHGIGLGLTLVRNIVDSHGGLVDLESRPGEGATFRVWLPATASTNRRRTPTPPAAPGARR
jgi:two-component system sensor histidine kinase PilS (NtrC family)